LIFERLHGSEPTVFLVDDEPSVLKAIARLLRSSGFNVQTFRSPEEFLSGYDPNTSGCLVLDVAMPGLNGLDLQEALCSEAIDLPIIFLTARGDIPMSVQAMKRGAVDFLQKPANDKELLKAIQDGIDRDTATRQERTDRFRIQQRLATLTPREKEVLAHIISGKPNKEVAADLGIVEKTIKVHRARVMAKMNAQSLVDLVRIAERAGIKPASRHSIEAG
jgi:RNA polymerase sigma factor (sigma-70 family)